MSVTLSAGVRQNLLSLQQTADMMSQTQNRLATGKKVTSALDNPTNFFTSKSLNSRAGELSNLLDGISNATKTLEAADNGIKAITKLVESAQSTARQALPGRWRRLRHRGRKLLVDLHQRPDAGGW
jgi:flagellin